MVGPRVLQGESLEAFNEGIGYILNNWSALQTAIDYEMGDNNFHPKVEQLIANVRSWFAQSKEPHHIGKLAILIKENMNVAFDLVIGDGSVEDMAAEVMGLHAECLEENFENIKLLRQENMNDLLMHASQCRSARCRYPNCRKVKGLFRHGMYCKTRASGGCVLCKKMWYLIQFHARACKKSDCKKVPRCSDVKEHLRKLQQQSNSQQRAACSDGNDEA